VAGKNWIKDAVKRPGALTRKARSAGMSVSEFANKATRPGSKASTQTKRQANLAKTLRKLG
jgi:aconitase A